MADTQTIISDVKLFLERLKKDLPEVFGKAEEKPVTEIKLGKKEPSVLAIEGNKVLYNGDLYQARMYITPDQEEGVAFDGSIFHVYLQNEQSDPSTLVTQWLKNKAKEVLPAKTKEWAEKMGAEYNNIVVKDQQTVWGSCSSKKNLNFSYRIIKMPLAVQDYLIVHELCHLMHMNHSPEYWALVAQYCPDYKIHKRWLNENKDALFAQVTLTYRQEPQPTPEEQKNAPAENASAEKTEE